MRKVKLTTAVIRGIIALGRPGMVQAMRGELTHVKMNELSIYRSHIDDANKALDWAARTHQDLMKPAFDDIDMVTFD